MEKIYFDSLPSIIVAYNRTILPNYDALGMHLVTVVAPEMARLGCECPEPGRPGEMAYHHPGPGAEMIPPLI